MCQTQNAEHVLKITKIRSIKYMTEVNINAEKSNNIISEL